MNKKNIIVMASVLGVFLLADAILTYFGLNRGFIEQNAIVSFLYNTFYPAGLFAWLMLYSVVVALLSLLIYRKWPKEISSPAVLLFLSALIISEGRAIINNMGWLLS